MKYRSNNLSVYRLLLTSPLTASNVLKIEIFMLITMKSVDLISPCIVLSKQIPPDLASSLAFPFFFCQPRQLCLTAQPSALSQFHQPRTPPAVPSSLTLNILRPLCGVRSRGLVEYPTTVLRVLSTRANALISNKNDSKSMRALCEACKSHT